MYKSTQENELFFPRSFVYKVSNTREKKMITFFNKNSRLKELYN